MILWSFNLLYSAFLDDLRNIEQRYYSFLSRFMPSRNSQKKSATSRRSSNLSTRHSSKAVRLRRCVYESLEPRQMMASDSNAGIGLLAQYYNASDLTAFQAAAITSNIDAQWNLGSPVVGTPTTALNPDNFSVRWSGQIESEFTELHSFFVNAEGGVRLWVNGQLIVNRWNDVQITNGTGSINLVSGRRYDIQLEFRETSGNASVRLEWSSPSLNRDIIPNSNLFASERGSIAVEQWNGINGSTVVSLTSIPQYAAQPNSVTSITTFETPANTGDNFGRRIRGQVHISETGDYRFYVAGDQAAELWLSNSSDPSGKQLIASVSSPTNARDWTANASQQSSPIRLVAGQSYYIESLQKESTGVDHLAIGWRRPGASSVEVIPGDALSPALPTVQLFAIAPSTIEGASTTARFSILRDGGPLTNPLTVAYRIRGTATNGIDYTLLSGTITIPAGQSAVELTLSALSDVLNEGTEQAKIELTDGPGYDVGLISQRTAIATIQDIRPAPSGGVSQLAGSRLVNFTNRYGATYTEVTDNDPSTNFGLVIQAAIATKPATVFNVQLSQNNAQPIAPGDILYAEFFIRSIGGPGQAQVVYELAGAPYTKILNQSISVPTNWTRVQIPTVASASYTTNTASFSFQLGAQAQTLQIARIQLLNYGPSKNLAPETGLGVNNINGSWGTTSTVSVTGQPFTSATQIQTVTAPPSNLSWQFQTVMRNAASVKLGNNLSVEFYARSVAGALPRVQFQSQRTDTYASVYALQSVAITPTWTKFTYNFPATADFATNGLQLVFIAGFGIQTVEIADLRWTNTNGAISVEELPTVLSAVSYVGRDGESTWRDDADTRINQNRQAQVTVNVVDANGLPVDGAVVSIQQTKHLFKFGVAADNNNNLLTSTTNANALQYQSTIKRLFNTVVVENSMKWPPFSTNRQQGIDAANWVVNNGFYLRGHNIVWPSRNYLPSSVWTQYDTLNATDPMAARNYLKTTIENRITDAVNTFEGKAGEWDVMNEPFSENDVMAILGNDIVLDWFRQVGQISPNTKRALNDYDIFARNGGNTAHRTNFDYWLGRLDGANLIEIIGEQSHYSDGNLTDIEVLGSLISLYHTTYDLPIAITELDINSKDQQLQADYLRDYLTQSFSQPGISEIVQWGFWSQAHWLPDAALYNADFSIKANGQVYEDLVFGDWWTDTRGTTRAGSVMTDATLGDYDVVVRFGDLTVTRKISELSGATTLNITLPGVRVTPTVLASSEGSSTSYTLALSTQPTSNVVVNLVGAPLQASLNATTFTFTTANWNTPQTVTVGLIEDFVAEGNQQLVINQSIPSSDPNYNAMPVASVTVNFTDGVDNSPKLIGSVQVANNATQRSQIKEVTVLFDRAIDIDAGAFSVAKRTKNLQGSLVLVPVTTVVTAMFLTSGQTRITLTFTSSVRTNTLALEDGNYQLTIDGSKVRTAGTSIPFDGDRNVATPGGKYVFGALETDRFFSQFGNINSDRQVDRVDFNTFRRALGRSVGQGGYREQFDFNGDGRIDASDFAAFMKNYARRLTF